ncbi:MAG TPA: hypothetical protein VKB26_03755 [Candidatus Acidoferrales bacterium]|nr:hypothetical protein [Candidatus Acidoferrales bacterium]
MKTTYRCIAVFGFLCFAGPTYAQMQSLTAKDTWSSAKLSTQEIHQITAAVEDSAFDTPDSWEGELRVRRVDLGGSPGIVAQGTKLLCGGTGNCQIFVLRKTNDKWLSLFKADAPIGDGFQLGRSLTHGIKDLTVTMNSSAAKSGHTVYKFDGQFYQKAP